MPETKVSTSRFTSRFLYLLNLSRKFIQAQIKTYNQMAFRWQKIPSKKVGEGIMLFYLLTQPLLNMNKQSID